MMNMRHTNTKNLTEGTIAPQLISLAAPLIAGSILQQLYNTIDAVVIGRFVGQTAFAGAGVAGTVMNLFVFILTGCCTGFSVVLAQCYGSGDIPKYRQTHFLALVSGMGLTLLFSCFGVSFVTPLLRAINTPDDVLVFARQYLILIFLGLPATYLYNFYSALLRSVGNTRSALMFLAIATVSNFGLDLLFVAAFRLGIQGAALATVTAQGLSVALCLLYLRKKQPELRFTRQDSRFSGAILKQLWSVSAATALHQSSLYLGKLLVQGAVNGLGTSAIAAYTATGRVEGFINSFGTSGSSAMSIFTAQNYGAGKRDRVRKGFLVNLRIQFCFGQVSCLVFYFAAVPALTLVLGSGSPAALESGVAYLHRIALFYIVCFLGNNFTGHFHGVGKAFIPFMGTTMHISLRVVLSYWLTAYLGLNAVAYATGIGWILGNTFWALLYLRELRLDKKG